MPRPLLRPVRSRSKPGDTKVTKSDFSSDGVRNTLSVKAVPTEIRGTKLMSAPAAVARSRTISRGPKR